MTARFAIPTLLAAIAIVASTCATLAIEPDQQALFERSWGKRAPGKCFGWWGLDEDTNLATLGNSCSSCRRVSISWCDGSIRNFTVSGRGTTEVEMEESCNVRIRSDVACR